jgi:RNA polymerase sigma-70 factor (ECF subfamily)
MGAMMTNDESETDRLLQRAAAGDAAGWGELLARNEARLRRMIAFRLDQRLQGRIDASDVLQEVYLEAFTNLSSYRREAAVPFFLWLRGITGNKLLELQRSRIGKRLDFFP